MLSTENLCKLLLLLLKCRSKRVIFEKKLRAEQGASESTLNISASNFTPTQFNSFRKSSLFLLSLLITEKI